MGVHAQPLPSKPGKGNHKLSRLALSLNVAIEESLKEDTSLSTPPGEAQHKRRQMRSEIGKRCVADEPAAARSRATPSGNGTQEECYTCRGQGQRNDSTDSRDPGGRRRRLNGASLNPTAGRMGQPPCVSVRQTSFVQTLLNNVHHIRVKDVPETQPTHHATQATIVIEIE